MTLFRKGACLSTIEERPESCLSRSSDRSNEGELYSEEERISVQKTVLINVAWFTSHGSEFRVRWFLDSQAEGKCEVIRNDRILN